MYATVGNISYDHLTDDQMEWLEKEDLESFVEITEGDESVQYAIDSVTFTLTQIVDMIGEGERVLVTQDSPESRHLDSIGWTKTKAWLDGEVVYVKPENSVY